MCPIMHLPLLLDDKSLQFDTPDYVMVEFQNSAVDNGSMVLSKAFVKSENGKTMCTRMITEF